MVKRCAIVLAGGKAERFQVKDGPWVDKALAIVLGKPMLIHVIERLRSLVEETIICVNNDVRKRRYMKVLRDFSIKDDRMKIVTDLKIPSVSGPAVAITTGLSATSADYCVIAPCDTPFIQPAVIEYLFNIVKGASIAVPIHADGSIETIMFTCERRKTAEVSETLCWLRRDRPDDLLRGLPKVNFISTVSELRRFDPEFKSFININFREDLTELRTRVVTDGPVKESIFVNLGSPESSELRILREAAKKRVNEKLIEAISIFSSLSNLFEGENLYFWAGVCREMEGNALQGFLERHVYVRLEGEWREGIMRAFIKAAQNYAFESEVFIQRGINLLAKRAKEDEAWCKQRITTILRERSPS